MFFDGPGILGGHGLVRFCLFTRKRFCAKATPFSSRAFHWSAPSSAPFTEFCASFMKSSTALPQSAAAVSPSGILNSSPFGIIHGGTDSVQLFKHLLAGAPLSQDISNTLLAQQAFAESCPRTDAQVG